MASTLKGWFKSVYVIFVFISALFLGGLKALAVGPIACLILIIGNVGVILGLLPVHVVWTVYTIVKANRFDAPLKVGMLFALPVLFGIWLALSIACSVLVGLGYGFFTPWVSTFEAFRQENELKKFLHSILDGTWGTIKGSCTVVRDFADICYHSYPLYLKELRDSSPSNELQTLRLIYVPGCIAVGLIGLIVEIPLYTAIAIAKSPYLLFKGWQRLIHDLISREGPFLETACIPVAGLTILMWPLVVIGSILMAIFSSFFVGLYGSVIVHQERSFRRGVAYVIAMVAEFDEYTNDWLYLREGSILPKPRYRNKKVSHSIEISVGGNHRINSASNDAPSMLVPSLAQSRSVRETIQEVKVVQIWRNMMRCCETRMKELVEGNVITQADLHEWCKAKSANEASIVGVGVPCYSLLQTLLHSINSGSAGLIMCDGLELNHLNSPHDRLLDWFFHPIMLLKEQIKALELGDGEARFMEKLVLFGSNAQRMEAWDNGSIVPQDALRAAQIQGICRRMFGLTRSVSKLPTYRRKFRHIVKDLTVHPTGKEGSAKSGSTRSGSIRSVASAIDIV